MKTKLTKGDCIEIFFMYVLIWGMFFTFISTLVDFNNWPIAPAIFGCAIMPALFGFTITYWAILNGWITNIKKRTTEAG